MQHRRMPKVSPAAGLVLISYPLHPPGRPDNMRTDHFGSLDLPCLFLSGSRDAFGSPAELELALELIPGPVTLHHIDRGDHGLHRPRRRGGRPCRWMAHRTNLDALPLEPRRRGRWRGPGFSAWSGVCGQWPTWRATSPNFHSPGPTRANHAEKPYSDRRASAGLSRATLRAG